MGSFVFLFLVGAIGNAFAVECPSLDTLKPGETVPIRISRELGVNGEYGSGSRSMLLLAAAGENILAITQGVDCSQANGGNPPGQYRPPPCNGGDPNINSQFHTYVFDPCRNDWIEQKNVTGVEGLNWNVASTGAWVADGTLVLFNTYPPRQGRFVRIVGKMPRAFVLTYDDGRGLVWHPSTSNWKPIPDVPNETTACSPGTSVTARGTAKMIGNSLRYSTATCKKAPLTKTWSLNIADEEFHWVREKHEPGRESKLIAAENIFYPGLAPQKITGASGESIHPIRLLAKQEKPRPAEIMLEITETIESQLCGPPIPGMPHCDPWSMHNLGVSGTMRLR